MPPVWAPVDYGCMLVFYEVSSQAIEPTNASLHCISSLGNSCSIPETGILLPAVDAINYDANLCATSSFPVSEGLAWSGVPTCFHSHKHKGGHLKLQELLRLNSEIWNLEDCFHDLAWTIQQFLAGTSRLSRLFRSSTAIWGLRRVSSLGFGIWTWFRIEA